MSTSVFSPSGRDRFRRPYKGTGSPGTPTSLDAGFVQVAQDALVAIESLTRNAVTLESFSSRANGLCTAVQHWTVSYDGSTPYGGDLYNPKLLLDLSSTFLEDAGLIETQTSSPEDPGVSLASSVGTEVPRFAALPADLSGIGALPRPQPSWTLRLRNAPLLRVSVRLVGATGEQVFTGGSPTFFDAGTGTSPKMLLPILFSLPSQWQNTVPVGTYDVCLLVMNWVR